MSVEPGLAALPTLSKEALGDLWKQFFGSTPPTQLRRNLMIPILAYRIQEHTFGPLSSRARQDCRYGRGQKTSARNRRRSSGRSSP